ncbi:undecaprenyl-diphosphatase UppP [Candidatus Peregrinibacteria bacterium]|nr:undecaprenyl-diphosphatase UppP [Candidatus Peregrinibacteria bacterium]
MTLFEAVLLGVVQGITEFLPISSSGHLILVEDWLGLHVESLKSFDIAVHFGTLVAIFAYFRKDFSQLFLASVAIVKRKKGYEKEKKLIKWLVLATLPAVFVGLFLGDTIDFYARSSFSVAIVLILVGLIFFIAEYVHSKLQIKKINFLNSFIIGCAQAIALIPGVSRSGITITAGIFQGIKREEAARFSFLLGSIAITAATLLAIVKSFSGDIETVSLELIIAGLLASGFSGFFAVSFLMKYLKKHSLRIFGLYRIILGVLILLFYL